MQREITARLLQTNISPREKETMEFADRVLKCIDCNAEFIFAAGEQLFFHEKRFVNDPKHCKACKAKRGTRILKETPVTCSECGQTTTVPFKPTQGRPVLCRVCFQKAQMTLRTPPASEC
jgi:CxxC-x17-CxxC domain-containing protein